MVLKVTRLRTRGFTSRCVPLAGAFCGDEDPFMRSPVAKPRFDIPSDEFVGGQFEPALQAILENEARIVAGGSPARADCGYRPRSATSMADGSKSLPTMWIDQSLPTGKVPDEVGSTWPGAAPKESLMPPLRPAEFFPPLDPPPLEPLGLALPFPVAVFVALLPAVFSESAALAAMAME